jgi:hypothetical protein
LNEQKFINESLCALNCLGKWIWNGGFTSGSYSRSTSNLNKSFKISAFERDTVADYIKWSKEVINTCPNNFELMKFEEDCSSILIRTSGIYEVVFTFFIPHEGKQPSV